MTDQQKPSPPEPREPDMARYFPGNRRWPDAERTRDAYGNFRPGNKPSALPLHAGGYPYDERLLAPISTPCAKHLDALRLTDTPVRVTAGGSMTPIPLDAVFVDLTRHSRHTSIVTGLPGPRPITVRVTWPDMTIPQLSRDDWRIIATRLAELKRHVHVACEGGHGRTGTTLAILLALWGVIPAGIDPVTWVRANYCDKAIETEAQVDYARRMVRP